MSVPGGVRSPGRLPPLRGRVSRPAFPILGVRDAGILTGGEPADGDRQGIPGEVRVQLVVQRGLGIGPCAKDSGKRRQSRRKCGLASDSASTAFEPETCRTRWGNVSTW